MSTTLSVINLNKKTFPSYLCEMYFDKILTKITFIKTHDDNFIIFKRKC